MTTVLYANPDSSPVWDDMLSLGAHVRACAAARGRTFAMRCVGERVHAVLSSRFITTVFAATALMALLTGCA
jgi:hypothetical protein